MGEPFSSRPRRPTASDGRWPEFPIKSTESCRAQHRPAVLKHQGVGSVTRAGIGVKRLQLDVRVDSGQGQIHWCVSAATRRSGSNTVWSRSMK